MLNKTLNRLGLTVVNFNDIYTLMSTDLCNVIIKDFKSSDIHILKDLIIKLEEEIASKESCNIYDPHSLTCNLNKDTRNEQKDKLTAILEALKPLQEFYATYDFIEEILDVIIIDCSSKKPDIPRVENGILYYTKQDPNCTPETFITLNRSISVDRIKELTSDYLENKGYFLDYDNDRKVVITHKDIIIEKLEDVDIDKDFVLIADYIFNKYENI